MAFAGALWITGALPLPVTALLVPVALVALGVYADFADSVTGFDAPRSGSKAGEQTTRGSRRQ